MHVVIVGNSIAGIEAALALRQRDADARITIVGDEHAHPFARVSLMYLFCGQLSLRDAEFHDRDLYPRLRFERVTDRVTHVDVDRRTLRLAGGGTLAYDQLLLAVGSVARPLPFPDAYPGVHHFVTLGDAARLNVAAKPGLSAAVVGGGLIGVEVAEILHQRGLRTHFLVREPWYLPVALDAGEAEVVAEHLRRRGVECVTNAPVGALRRTDAGFVLDVPDGALEVDLVVGAIGVVPNTAFLADSGVALSPETGGVETRDDLRSTSAPDVWAAGDCAQVTWPDGSRRPEQLWYTARDQGRAAARSMLGDDVVYRRGTWYNSAKFFDVEYTTAGWIPTAPPGADPPAPREGRWQTWFQRVPGEAVTQRIVCRDGVVKGFNALGSRWDHQAWLRWIQERRTLDWVLAHMDEARFDEEFTPRFRVLPTARLSEGA